jgi:3',5'-cyclic AMP phosphodiesterase CpdA
MKTIFRQTISVAIISIVFIILYSCNNSSKEQSDQSFNFVFFTDIHLQPEKRAEEGFKLAIDYASKFNPDFILTGGDLIMDACDVSYERADSLFNMYKRVIDNINIPIYNTIGNHELYGIYKKSNADPLHPEFNEKMFEKRIGKSFYSFKHKGWKFIILNSIKASNNRYIGHIDSIQVKWIESELTLTDTATPIVIVSHIPFITAYKQKYEGATLPNDSSLVVANSKQVLNLFGKHNLRLVLQGHLHIKEAILIDEVYFITAGAISGRWWNGPNRGTEEGFLNVTVNGNDFDWKYVDYGWDVK